MKARVKTVTVLLQMGSEGQPSDQKSHNDGNFQDSTSNQIQMPTKSAEDPTESSKNIAEAKEPGSSSSNDQDSTSNQIQMPTKSAEDPTESSKNIAEANKTDMPCVNLVDKRSSSDDSQTVCSSP
ncbi:hypothetical protein THAOC_20633 [Thalassiosira oceanica]|uniref:Uncharacterized protein n=1 Tax=Thalassiosira oceanica TaxID=159749 RepID=K0S324_THAOC|nr:hypothetical protein THAOC_20633 [Thalassiosira oceanica]|eukprot:EJK59179.1 hypothetical protein THAOC_20633 [Thalassiosira oceanica]